MPRLLLLLPTATYRAEEFLEAASRLGVEVTAASEHRSTLAGANPEGLLALDLARPEAAARRAGAFARRYPVDAVVGVDDGSAAAAAAIAARLGLPHNPPAAVGRARDKHLARQAMRDAGLPTPWFRLFPHDEPPARASRSVPYPCVLKPTRLSASRGVIRADDPAEFEQAWDRILAILEASRNEGQPGEQNILVESFIPGREVALEGLLTAGSLQVLCLFDKPEPLDGPYFEETLFVTPSRLSAAEQAAVAAGAARAAEALGLREGPVHAELRVNEAGAWILEVNPRSIGGRCSRALRFGAGMSLEEVILRHALGMEIPTLERERRAAGVLMLPIPRAGVLAEVRGREAALGVPGVEELILTARPGQRLAPLPEGSPYAGFLFARGEAPAAVEAALRQASGRLELCLEEEPDPAGSR